VTHFGVHTGQQECTIGELVALWKRAEELGFEWISIWDHFYPAQVDPAGDCFEAVASHAAVAVTTTRVRVGSLVYCAGYRHPAVLANAGVTIDHLSDGRLELGLGAGWHETEFRGYGLPFEPPAVRLRRLGEAVEVIRLLWTEDVVQYQGEFVTLTDAFCNPKPIQTPPRLWIGASGEQLALPLVGRLADGWNVPYVSPEAFARKLAIVRQHTTGPRRIVTGVNVGLVFADKNADEELRRRYGPAVDFIKEGSLHGSVGEVVDKVGRYQEAGADWINLGLRAPFDFEALERFATQVVPQSQPPRPAPTWI
jgi:alkanesulfonate monooxygenase SsuD/methylene tetrahydromethanopterin reductase-like flavin-dependent oxidoreductase (luciferase family)